VKENEWRALKQHIQRKIGDLDLTFECHNSDIVLTPHNQSFYTLRIMLRRRKDSNENAPAKLVFNK